MPRATVLATSVTTGDGLDELRQRLANAVAGRTAARARLAGDVRGRGRRAGGARRRGRARGRRRRPRRAARRPRPQRRGADRRRGRRRATTGWRRPPAPGGRSPGGCTGCVRDPLRRLRLDGRDIRVTDADVRSVLGRSSLPAAEPGRARRRRPRHPPAGRPGRARRCRSRGRRPWSARRTRPAPRWATPSTRPSSAPRCTPGHRSGGGSWGWPSSCSAVAAVVGFALAGALRRASGWAPARPGVGEPSDARRRAGAAACCSWSGCSVGCCWPWSRAGWRGSAPGAAAGSWTPRLRASIDAVAQDRIVLPVERVLERHAATRLRSSRAADV